MSVEHCTVSLPVLVPLLASIKKKFSQLISLNGNEDWVKQHWRDESLARKVTGKAERFRVEKIIIIIIKTILIKSLLLLFLLKRNDRNSLLYRLSHTVATTHTKLRLFWIFKSTNESVYLVQKSIQDQRHYYSFFPLYICWQGIVLMVYS